MNQPLVVRYLDGVLQEADLATGLALMYLLSLSLIRRDQSWMLEASHSSDAGYTWSLTIGKWGHSGPSLVIAVLSYVSTLRAWPL